MRKGRQAVLRKWKTDIDGLSPEQQRARARVWQYWHGRHVPRIWAKQARSEAQNGEFGSAVMLYAAAAFRYLYFAVSTNDRLFYGILDQLKPSWGAAET
jgi:hypothetical protein